MTDLEKRMAEGLERTMMFISGYCSENVFPDTVDLISEATGDTREVIMKRNGYYYRDVSRCPSCGKRKLQQSTMKWISVEDRMPEVVDRMYLVFENSCLTKQAYYHSKKGWMDGCLER